MSCVVCRAIAETAARPELPREELPATAAIAVLGTLVLCELEPVILAMCPAHVEYLWRSVKIVQAAGPAAAGRGSDPH